MAPEKFPDTEAFRLDTPSEELICRARDGDSRALSSLFRRQGAALERWTRGKLPRWARKISDTADVVQDVLLKTFRHLDRFEHRGRGALQGYLREAVKNRIRDELRRVERRPQCHELPASLQDGSPSPFQQALDEEQARRYKAALAELSEADRMAIVARVEMGYTYEQLALVRGRSTPGAARVAVHRAIEKLAQRMTRA